MSKSIIFLLKSLLGNFYRHLAIISGHTEGICTHILCANYDYSVERWICHSIYIAQVPFTLWLSGYTEPSRPGQRSVERLSIDWRRRRTWRQRRCGTWTWLCTTPCRLRPWWRGRRSFELCASVSWRPLRPCKSSWRPQSRKPYREQYRHNFFFW